MPNRRSTLYLFINLALLVSILWSCSDPISSEPDPEEAEFIRPLTLGNKWFGTLVRYDHGGPYATILTIDEVVGDTVWAGIKWTELYHETDDTSEFAFTYSTFLRNDSVGQWVTLALGTPENLLAMYPATALDSLPYDMEDTIVQVIVTATDTLLTVPAGVFSCYNYRYSFVGSWEDTTTVSYYYSPGVGRIRSEFYSTSSNVDTAAYLRQLWELDSLVLVTP